MRVSAAIVLVFPLVLHAQAGPTTTQHQVRELLKDAEYNFRRFEDLTGRIDVDHWSAPNDLRRTSRQALDGVLSQVNDGLGTVDRLEHAQGAPSAADLLFVDGVLVSTALELDELSRNVLDFQDQATSDMFETPALSVELARAGAATTANETKLLAILVQQVVAEERELARCRQKSR